MGCAPHYNARVSEPLAAPIRATTRLCAVFGHPIAHSASPAMQNAGIAALGLDWRYVGCDVYLPVPLGESPIYVVGPKGLKATVRPDPGW